MSGVARLTVVDDDTPGPGLPHDLAVEEALLGTMLLSGAARTAACGTVTADDFYKPAHGHIYTAITDIHTTDDAVDATTVAAWLAGHGILDTAGGPAAIMTVLAHAGHTGNASRYAAALTELALARRVLAATAAAAEGLRARPGAATATLAAFQADLDALTPVTGTLRRIPDELEDWLDVIDERAAGTVAGLPTGWADLDEILGGLHPGQLVVVAGRPGMGKTQFGAGLALHAAATTTVLVASVEMALHELLDRWASATSHLHLARIRRGELGPRDMEILGGGLARMSALDLWVLDDPAATVGAVTAAARRVGAGLVIVDYLQIMDAVGGRGVTREREVAQLSAGLKRLARSMQVPVVALSQLNRGLEVRSDKRPALADLRESGAIENDADVVIGLYRDEVYNPDTPDRGVIEVNVLKQRQGSTGRARLAWMPETARIENLRSM